MKKKYEYKQKTFDMRNEIEIPTDAIAITVFQKEAWQITLDTMNEITIGWLEPLKKLKKSIEKSLEVAGKPKQLMTKRGKDDNVPLGELKLSTDCAKYGFMCQYADLETGACTIEKCISED